MEDEERDPITVIRKFSHPDTPWFEVQVYVELDEGDEDDDPESNGDVHKMVAVCNACHESEEIELDAFDTMEEAVLYSLKIREEHLDCAVKLPEA